MGKAITFSIIFKGQSLNYGEGIGNISELKKLTRNDGNYYSLATRQALTYDIRRLGSDIFNWNLQTVDKSKGTVQFKDEFTIKDSEEMDLFGYMKTKKSKSKKKNDKDEDSEKTEIRAAIARFSTAISLEPYKSDMDFLSNKGFADRIGEHSNLANSEQHLSYYTYTVTIDLDKVGIDGAITLGNAERARRVCQLLDLIKILNRNIRGRQENLSPLFIIGGMYPIANPFFLGRIELETIKGKFNIKTEPIKDALDMTILDCNVKDNTSLGLVSGIFENQDDLNKLMEKGASNIELFFKELKNEVNSYYGV